MCVAFVLCGVGSASAAVRFGDANWVAPALPAANDTSVTGPRVAPRDRERRWESVLRAPFRVAFYPLHLLANGFEGGMGIMGPRFGDRKPPRAAKLGITLAPTVHLGGIDDIGIGPALTWTGMPTSHAKLHLSGTLSAIDHRRARVRWTLLERAPLSFRARADYDDKPNTRYYGIGNTSDVDRLAYYRLVNSRAEAAAQLGSSPLRRLALQGGYSAMRPGRASHASPFVEDAFTPTEAPFRSEATRHLWYGLAGDLAALDEPRAPSRGVHGRLDVRRLMGVHANDPDYDQWTLEGRAYLPVFAKRRVLAMRAVYAGVRPRGDEGSELPFYRLAQSVESSRLPGFASGRFRDRLLAHGRIEYRWLVFHGISALALYDVGQVQPREGMFRLGDIHRSYGGGLRMGLSDAATARVELANSVEGLHAVLMLGGDF